MSEILRTIELSKALQERDQLQTRIEQYDEAFAKLEEERDQLKAQLEQAQQQNLIHREASNGNYWAWQGDGEDHLESLVCPVAIRPHQLQVIIDERGQAQAECAEMRDVANYMWTILCNVSSGDWKTQSEEWQRAVEKCRDEYHKAISTTCGRGWFWSEQLKPTIELLEPLVLAYPLEHRLKRELTRLKALVEASK